jgi:hypothetical protein
LHAPPSLYRLGGTFEALAEGEAVSRAGRPFAWVAAISLFVAATWFALIDKNVSVGTEPTYDPSLSLSVNLSGYFDWFRTTLVQERIDTSIAILGFASLIVVGFALRERLGKDDARAAVGALAITIGSMLWIVGNVLQLGGHRAVGLMSGAANPVEAVNSIVFTIDTIDDWFELFGFAFLGVGLISLAWAQLQVSGHRLWVWLSFGTGAVLLVLSGAYVDGNGDVIDPILVLGGMVLLPAWLIWTAERELRASTT